MGYKVYKPVNIFFHLIKKKFILESRKWASCLPFFLIIFLFHLSCVSFTLKSQPSCPMIQKICNLDLNAIRLQVLCALVVVFIACKSILICLDICSICQNMTRNNTEKIHPCKRSVHTRGTEATNLQIIFNPNVSDSKKCVILEMTEFIYS